MTEQLVPYRPETFTAPGEIIADLLEERGLSQKELARRMGRPQKTINEIIHGKAALTPETANQLELVLGTPASYWLTHEAHYRAYLARRHAEDEFAASYDWLDRMPLRELKEQGILPNLRNQGQNKTALVRSLLQFFGVASPREWEQVYGEMRTAYRRSMPDQSDSYATAAWLRLGELQAVSLACNRYDRVGFAAALEEIRNMTVLPPEEFGPMLKEACALAGVVLALVPALARARVSGAARWVLNRPVIQLSLYGKTNDRFWFTFFHEAGHILKHSHKLVFLDELDGAEPTEEEHEANRFAAEVLIPHAYRDELPTLRSKDAVRAFAGRLGIHPGIVVGRLQHDGLIEPSWMNDLKDTLNWTDESRG
jgi:HTH-type transcriptional regulator/antitoxin HigA